MTLDYIDIPVEDYMIDYTFSDNFVSRMNKILIEQKKFTWNLVHMARRNVVMIAIIVLGVFVTACGVTQVMYFFHADLYNENREAIIQEETIRDLEYVYKIHELPDGFEKVGISKGTGFLENIFQNKRGRRLLFLQTTNAEYRYILNEEQVTKETETIGDREVDIYKNDDLMGAIWIEDGCYMEIVYYGCEKLEDIRKIILSIE